MNQIPSHSQTPEFDANKSQTTSVLFQHPKPSEMRPSFGAKVKAVLKEVAAVGVIIATISSVTLTVHSCSNNVNRQHAAALKQQLQFQASNEGAR